MKTFQYEISFFDTIDNEITVRAGVVNAISETSACVDITNFYNALDISYCNLTEL